MHIYIIICIVYYILLYKIQILAIRTVYRSLFQLLCSCPPVSILCVISSVSSRISRNPKTLVTPPTPPMDYG